MFKNVIGVAFSNSLLPPSVFKLHQTLKTHHFRTFALSYPAMASKVVCFLF